MDGGESRRRCPRPRSPSNLRLRSSFSLPSSLGSRPPRSPCCSSPGREIDLRTRTRMPNGSCRWTNLPRSTCSSAHTMKREILERTIVGALGMDYPNFRVWMLDDSRRAWVKTLCAELGCRYLSRSDNSHAKAGNIDHALKHIAALPD